MHKRPRIQEGPAWPRSSAPCAMPTPRSASTQGPRLVTYRQKFGSRYSSHPGSYWLTFAAGSTATLDRADRAAPFRCRSNSRPCYCRTRTRLLVVQTPMPLHHATTSRDITSARRSPASRLRPSCAARPGKKDPKLVERAKRKADAVKRIRDYRLENAESYRLLRAIYRHTEVSWTAADGSLEDMFRYAIDGRPMTDRQRDHDNGAAGILLVAGAEITDATSAGRFTPCSATSAGGYPHGHRNCVFASAACERCRACRAGPRKRVRVQPTTPRCFTDTCTS